MARLALVAALCHQMVAAVHSSADGAGESLVRTQQGLVRGRIRHAEAQDANPTAVAEYLGIPFAQPPLGEGRFAPPRPPVPWEGAHDATEFKHNCIQGSMNMGWPQPMSTQSEDCLYLNVYAPTIKPSKPVPVMFWIFGGGFQGGGGNETRLNGTWDVALQKGELIIVTHSYRLNIFGFLAAEELRARDAADGSTGNYGIQDQRAAMEWTHKNIANFGGDPGKIFIVGQSAGANSVSQHLVRPKSWPYFSSAGMESGAFYDGIDTATVASQRPTWAKLAEFLNCSRITPPASDAECIISAPMEALHRADSGCCGGWSITVDGKDLVAPGPVLAQQGKLAKVPIITGSVREDIGSYYSAILFKPGPPPPPASKCHPLIGKDKGLQCTEDDFRSFGESMGLDAADLNIFVAAYQGDENGHPAPDKMGPGCRHPVQHQGQLEARANASSGDASNWYWAIKHAGSDAWGTCPARRIAQWYTRIGQPAYWYFWQHVADGPNGCGGAHHANEQPFVFHVLSETPVETQEDKGHYHINASNPLEVTLSTQTVQFWATMAGTGSPGPSWPLYNTSKHMAMIFGDTHPLPAAPAANVRTAKCDFWDAQFAKVLAAHPDGRPSTLGADGLTTASGL